MDVCLKFLGFLSWKNRKSSFIQGTCCFLCDVSEQIYIMIKYTDANKWLRRPEK